MTSPCRDLIHSMHRLLTGRWQVRRQVLLAVASTSLLLSASSFAGAATVVGHDVLSKPALKISPHIHPPMVAVTYSGEALLGVGPHGVILRSEDYGQNWSQVPSPVSSDLVQVRFTDPKNGWIVGHDALLLHSGDGGRSWQVRLDGRQVLVLLREYYSRAEKAGDQQAGDLLREIDLAMKTSATPDVLPTPLLDVSFDDKGTGFVVGAFGLMLRSEDAGATWEPWIERADNERRMHLYGLAQHHGQFYACGEQGLLMRLDAESQRFVRVETPYGGTFFGVAAHDGLLLAYGLRGNLYASQDDGRDWRKVEAGLDSSVVGLVEEAGSLVLVSQSGRLAVLEPSSLLVRPLEPMRSSEVYAASRTGQDGHLLVATYAGARVVQIATAK
ncbi:glycosyl hydrolase [Pseudomonas aeruginosa]|nr:glycosyl hydrolase [Pseudomonas aeruginosa]EKU9151896.1 glycosyl hydrolase [Pseudomonas aeruginosa]EKW2385215.1 glycosyl hydrolase [Pseudomonas aeruginosa]ELB4692627.1 glycosyl hydrolase [Pseudomonas aeruginosa]MBD1298866.1 glycosyl hydrolase [Pseudomonas aeruginosa]